MGATIPKPGGRRDPRDPLARRSPLLVRAFGQYLRWYFRRHFHAVRLSRAGVPKLPHGRPLIVYGNHPSWWDPILFILLTTRLFADRPSFGPMEATALSRYPVLERMGVFGIEPDSARGAARFLELGRRILADPDSILWITTEGQFTDPRQRPLRLRPGLAHLLRRNPNAVILPLAIEYTFWNESRPEALVRFGDLIDPSAMAARGVADWTAFLAAGLTNAMDALAAESATRSAGNFRPLVQGGAGIGGLYDLWRRGRAWAGLRRFDPTHEGGEP